MAVCERSHKPANGSSYLKNGQNGSGDENRGSHCDDIDSRAVLEVGVRKQDGSGWLVQEQGR